MKIRPSSSLKENFAGLHLRRSVQIRIPGHLERELRKALRDMTLAREPVVFALASSSHTPRRDLVLVRELIKAPESAFIRDASHGARWTGGFNIELMNRCAADSLGVLIFHPHAGKSVRMSLDDLQSAATLIPYFQSVVPQRHHGSIVLGEDSIDGRVWASGSKTPTKETEVRFLGNYMQTLSGCSKNETDMAAFQRLPLADSVISREVLSRTALGIVGLSGGGSQLITQFAALGFERIVGVDSQRFDCGNRYSTDAPRAREIKSRKYKTSVAERHVLAINPKCSFEGVRVDIPSSKAIEALSDVDILVGCVNNLHARADILELAGRLGIPYVDVGFHVGVDCDSPVGNKLTSLSGNVFTIMPGGPCMWCTGFLTKEKLAKEAGGGNRSYIKNRGKNSAQLGEAFVLSFNGVLASTAVTEVLQLVLGFVSDRPASRYLKYDGFSGEIHEWQMKPDASCPHCNNVVHAGDPIWS
jgi:hypothetical protein